MAKKIIYVDEKCVGGAALNRMVWTELMTTFIEGTLEDEAQSAEYCMSFHHPWLWRNQVAFAIETFHRGSFN